MRTTVFSTVRLGFFTASALAALLVTAAQSQTTLRWKFQKGEKLCSVSTEVAQTGLSLK
jgi:hypothetical protein